MQGHYKLYIRLAKRCQMLIRYKYRMVDCSGRSGSQGTVRYEGFSAENVYDAISGIIMVAAASVAWLRRCCLHVVSCWLGARPHKPTSTMAGDGQLNSGIV
jgi:hypothetical protein